jgi:hypothetical protein
MEFTVSPNPKKILMKECMGFIFHLEELPLLLLVLQLES